MKGSCLCGAVAFEVDEAAGPFELCHCPRCRKAGGSAYATFLYVKTEGYRLLRGEELIRSYAAPLLREPPAYTVWFCSRCGSPVPEPEPAGEVFEIPAGCLDGAPPIGPDKHIYVDLKADWEPLDRPLPRFTMDEIRAFRKRYGRVRAGPSGEPEA